MFKYVVSKEDCVRMEPFAGVLMMATSCEKMTISLVEMQPGAVIEEHSHPHEQIGYMIEGDAEFVIAGQSYHVVAGQMWRLPSNVPHKVIAGPNGLKAVDAFFPVRQDMQQTDSWGKQQ